MVPAQVFVAQHPEHSESSDHDLTIARIQDEHAARQALDGQRKQLQTAKDALVKETNGKKDELAKLDGEMEKWVNDQQGVLKIFDARQKKMDELKEKELAETRENENAAQT